MKIIVDTSCLSILIKVRKLEILRELFGEIYTTRDVVEELKEYSQDLKLRDSNFIKVIDVDPKTKAVLRLILGKGESSVIAAALDRKFDVLVLDDKKARKIAKSLGLKVVGTVAVLILAKKRGIIKDIGEILMKFREKGFYLSDNLIKKAVKDP